MGSPSAPWAELFRFPEHDFANGSIVGRCGELPKRRLVAQQPRPQAHQEVTPKHFAWRRIAFAAGPLRRAARRVLRVDVRSVFHRQREGRAGQGRKGLPGIAISLPRRRLGPQHKAGDGEPRGRPGGLRGIEQALGGRDRWSPKGLWF